MRQVDDGVIILIFLCGLFFEARENKISFGAPFVVTFLRDKVCDAAKMFVCKSVARNNSVKF